MTMNIKRFIFATGDNRTTEVSEHLWNALVSRSDIDRYKIEVVLSDSEDSYCKLWLNDKVYDLSSFDSLIETLVRDLYMSLVLAKEFAHKIVSAGEHNNKIFLGKF